MLVRVMYFARLRETLERESEQLELPPRVADVASLSDWLAQRGGAWEEVFQGRSMLLAAVNQEMAAPDTPLRDGDEVAFFPPVTGG